MRAWLAIRSVGVESARTLLRDEAGYSGYSYHVESWTVLGVSFVPEAMTVERQGASRDVADAHGKKWRVREMEMAESDGSATRRSLIALNDMVIRRFWTFPAGWRELSDRALLALINGPAQPHPDSESDLDITK